MARQPGQSFSKTACLEGCFPVRICQCLPKLIHGRTTGELATGSPGPSNVLLGNAGPGIDVDVTSTQTTYLNIVPHSLMPMVFPDGSGFLQQDNAPCNTAKIVQKWFEEHDKDFKILTWPSISPNLNTIQQEWDGVPTSHLKGLKVCASKNHSTPLEVLQSPFLNRSRLLWWHDGDLHNILLVGW